MVVQISSLFPFYPHDTSKIMISYDFPMKIREFSSNPGHFRSPKLPALRANAVQVLKAWTLSSWPKGGAEMGMDRASFCRRRGLRIQLL